jgi:hypothetical protein
MKKAYVLASLFLLAALVVPALAKDKAAKTKTSTVTGVVARVDPTSLTITVKSKGASEEKIVDTGAATKVQVQTAEDETTTNSKGKEVKHPKVADGAMADVKAGKHVTVTLAEDGKTAVCVLVHREHAGHKKAK